MRQERCGSLRRTGLERDLCRAVRGVDAEVGIAVVREGRVIASVGGDRPMPAMSTFKFPLALAVATRLDSLGLPLSAQLEVTGDDLWPDTWSPLREAHPAGGRFSFGELLRYTVAESDNCACDRLIREIGGIGALQRYVEGLPAEGLDFRMTEREMSGAPDAQRRNRATPEAMALLLDRFRHDSLFASEYRDFLWQTLCTTTTGMNKLRAGLPDGTTIGHKTGSSDRDMQGVKIADNDLGYVELPDGQRVCDLRLCRRNGAFGQGDRGVDRRDFTAGLAAVVGRVGIGKQRREVLRKEDFPSLRLFDVGTALRHARFDGRAGYGGGDAAEQAWVRQFRDQVVGTEFEPVDAEGGSQLRRNLLACQFRECVRSGELHRFVDLAGVDVECAAEDVGESQHVVHLVGVVGAARCDDHIGACRLGLVVGDFGIGIRQRHDQRVAGHRPHHVGVEYAGRRDAQKDVCADEPLRAAS